jgi:peptidoglycan hydrolase-like protein with peptidoglycan-binding domain
MIWRNIMKSFLGTSALILALCGAIFAQSKPAQAPSGTVADAQHPDQVQPAPEKIRVTPDVVRAAQQKLDDNGYKAGKPDGKVGPRTRAAVRKFQADNNLEKTGKLDESTLSHLNVGAGKTMAAAPGDIGRGAKAAGHDIAKGHPVAAAKAMGTGVGRAGKAVGEGTKSGVMGTKDKIASHKKSNENATTPPR